MREWEIAKENFDALPPAIGGEAEEAVEPLDIADGWAPRRRAPAIVPSTPALDLGLLQATEMLVRLDERLSAAHPAVQAGWIERAALAEAAASAWLDGDHVDAATLRLAAVNALAGPPQEAVSAALSVLALIRAGSRRSPRQMFTPRRLAALVSVRLPATPDGRRGARTDPAWLQERQWARDEAYPSLERAVCPHNTARWRTLPALAAAAAILATWRDSGCERLLGGAPGRVLATAWLRRQGLTAGPWLTPSLGFHGHAAEWSPSPAPSWPPKFHAAARRAAEHGLALHRQLVRAHEDLQRACQGRRAQSRIPRLVDLLIARPALGAVDAATALDVTPRAATGMIDDLRQSSGLIRELTGRGAFRFYGVV